MTSPLLPFQGDFDPRAFAFQDLAAECKDERLDIGKHDGSRSGLPKEGLQGLLMAFLHRYMIAKCASVSHACRCDATAANASYPFPPPDRLPPRYAGVGAAGDGGKPYSGLWWLGDDRLDTECGQGGDAFLEASHVVPPLPSVAVCQRLAKGFTPGPQPPPATVPDGHIWWSVAKSAAAWSGGRHG